jgi:hypothetical protein
LSTLASLNITDESAKNVFAVDVERSMNGDDIVTVLELPGSIHCAPESVRGQLPGNDLYGDFELSWIVSRKY